MRLRLLLVLTVALAGATPAASAPGAAPPPRVTGQVDQSTPIVGQLRRDLIAAGARAPRATRPSPAHPILLRSALRVTGAEPPVRALVVSFRSLSGSPCLGVAFEGRSVAPGPFQCLPPCRDPLCVEIYSGGPLPRGTRVLVGRAQPRVTAIRITGSTGPARRFRVSRSRVGTPPAAPVLVQVPSVRTVHADADGKEVSLVRFRA